MTEAQKHALMAVGGLGTFTAFVLLTAPTLLTMLAALSAAGVGMFNLFHFVIKS